MSFWVSLDLVFFLCRIRSARRAEVHVVDPCWILSARWCVRWKNRAFNTECYFQSRIRSGPGKPNQRKVGSWTFHRGIPEQKFEMWIVLVFLRKNTRIHKNGRNSWIFRFGPFLGLVCRGDSWENGVFIPGPSLAAEKQGLGLNISIRNEIFKPRKKFSSNNENLARGGMIFFMRSSENDFFRSPGRALWGCGLDTDSNRAMQKARNVKNTNLAKQRPTSPFPTAHFIECFRGRHKGGAQFYFIFAVLQTLFSCSAMNVFYLQTCTPMKGTPWSTAWSLLVSQELVLEVPKRGQLHTASRVATRYAAIRVPKEHSGHGRYRGETFSEIPPVLLGIPWPALGGPLRNHFWKKKRPQPYWGGDNSGNALEASNALNYRVWGIPAVLSTGIPGNALRAFPGSFRSLSGISSGKCQPYWGYGPLLRCGIIKARSLQFWILSSKLPNSDLVLLWIFEWISPVFQRKTASRNRQKNPQQISPRNLFGKMPLGFLQEPILDR